jgi:hypothetical protein
MRRLVAIIALAQLAPFSVPAALGHEAKPAPVIVFSPGEQTKPCECRARGQIYIVGEEICLNGQLALCAMDQNVTTWRGTGRSCPQASFSRRPLL